MSTSLAIGISVVLLALNAFFVGAEFALISARRSSIEPRAAEGSRAARTALKAMENVSLMMAGAQLGHHDLLARPRLPRRARDRALRSKARSRRSACPRALVHPIAFAIALGIIGYLHVVLGEMVPKNIALAGPDRAVLLLAPPLTLIVRVLRPAIALLNWIANRTLRAVGVEPAGRGHERVHARRGRRPRRRVHAARACSTRTRSGC